MKKQSRLLFKTVDILYILMIIMPIVAAIVIKVLTNPPTEGIDIAGADIFFSIPMPVQPLLITESQTNSFFIIVSLLGVCLFLTHGMNSGPMLKRYHVAEFIVEKVQNITNSNMGEYFSAFAPFVTAILALSGYSSLCALFGLYPPTSDVNIVGGWAILVFILITYYKLKCGPMYYVRSLSDPILLTPLNVISEIATPISMAFRHYGNVLSGAVISVLIGTALQGLSSMVFSFLPEFLSGIPFLQIGLPAILSIYFDVFSSLLQAYIFAMLTMLYISNGFSLDEYMKRKSKKQKHKKVIGGN